MPRISEFYGIAIEMYFRDHPPPHFHARYGGEEAVIAIATGEVIAGPMPGRALRLGRDRYQRLAGAGEVPIGVEFVLMHQRPFSPLP